MVIFLDIIKNKYAQFNDRALRTEYWYFVLFSNLLGLLFYLPLIISLIFESMGIIVLGAILLMIYSLGIIIPSIAVLVKRLHDLDKSGWFMLLSSIPIIGGIILIVSLFAEGTRGPNKYSYDPKATNELNHLGQKDLI